MIKVFNTDSEYNVYSNNNTNLDSGILCYIKENETAHFSTNNIDGEYKIYDLGAGGGDCGKKTIKTKFNVTSTSSFTFLINGNYLDSIAEMYIDGEKLDEAVFRYKFTTTGEHTVDFVFDELVPIPSNMFDNKYNLTEVEIPEGVIDIGFEAFAWDDRITKIVFPSTLRTIGEGAFRGLSDWAENVVILDGITVISENAFNNCTKLKSVSFPSTLVKIDKHSFALCKAFTSVNIPNSVNIIDVNSFGQCTNLTAVTIGSGITKIADQAFQNCSKLASVTINAENPPILGSLALNGNASGRKIYVPSSRVDVYKAATNWSEYANDIVAIP